jgi:iron complex outermembrane receptor protein
MRGSEFSLDGGANGRLDGSFLTGLDRDRTGLIVGLRGMRDGGWRPNSEQHLGQVYGRWVRQVSDRATLDVGAQLYGAGWDSPGFLTASDFAARRFNRISDPTDGGFKRHGLQRASLRVLTSGSSLWRTTVYATQGNWNFFLTIPPEPGAGEGSGSQTQEIDRRTGWGATSALSWASARTEVTIGVQGRIDNADFSRWFTTRRNQDSSAARVAAQQSSAALFLQSSADLGRHLRIILGGRYDVIDTRTTPAGEVPSSDARGTFSPKAGVLLHLRRTGALYANISRGFRSSDGVVEDPTLPFITAWAYEGGLHLDLHHVNGTVAYFRTDVSNEQSFDPIHFTRTSGGRSRRQGVQLSLVGQLSTSARLTGSWTVTDAKYRDAVTADGESLRGTRVANTARYVGSAAVDFEPPAAHWMLRLSTNVVGPYTPFDEPGVELPAYGLLHLSGRYQVSQAAALRVGVRNLLGRVYPELRAGGFVSPGQGRAIDVGFSYLW